MRSLAARFMPAADNVGRLQSGSAAECRLFQQMAEHGHYAGRSEPSATRQGIYALAPDGRFLASINTREPHKVAQMLREALAAWDALALDGEPGASAPAAGAERSGDEAPLDGLILRVNSRDLPRGDELAPQPRDWRAAAWNQDFVWFRRDEARALVPEDPRALSTREVPRELVARLARLTLLDNVRGQVAPFRPESVERAELVSRATGVEGDVVTLVLEGHTRAAQTGRWPVQGFADRDDPAEQSRGLELELLGHARFDLARARFVAFELVAVGTRWGGTQFNGRGDDLGRAPIGFVLSLVGERPAERVAPANLGSYGW